MKNNIIIAKKLIKLAKILVGYNVDIYQKNLIKYKSDLIQLFNNTFDSIDKNENIKTKYFRFYYSIIYNLIVQPNKMIEEAVNMDSEIIQKYLKKIALICNRFNNTWAQFQPIDDINKYKVNDDIYNFYLTVSLNSKQDVDNYLQFLTELSNIFKKWIKEDDECCIFKTLKNLTLFNEHNDTFKLYYFNKNLKEKIYNVITKLLNKYHLKQNKRTYNWGKDVDSDKKQIYEFLRMYNNDFNNIGSFGERISKHIAENIIELIKFQYKNNKDKFNAEQLFDKIYDQFNDMVLKTSEKLIK